MAVYFDRDLPQRVRNDAPDAGSLVKNFPLYGLEPSKAPMSWGMTLM